MFIKPKRIVNRVFIHCSASDMNISGKELVMEITKWHQARKFLTIGYHFVIDKNGSLLNGRDIEIIPAAQEGNNTKTIAICVHGLNNFTEESLATLKLLCNNINIAYEGNISFHGHCEVNPQKTCPIFDYRHLLDLDSNGRIRNDKKNID